MNELTDPWRVVPRVRVVRLGLGRSLMLLVESTSPLRWWRRGAGERDVESLRRWPAGEAESLYRPLIPATQQSSIVGHEGAQPMPRSHGPQAIGQHAETEPAAAYRAFGPATINQRHMAIPLTMARDRARVLSKINPRSHPSWRASPAPGYRPVRLRPVGRYTGSGALPSGSVDAGVRGLRRTGGLGDQSGSRGPTDGRGFGDRVELWGLRGLQAVLHSPAPRGRGVPESGKQQDLGSRNLRPR